MGEHPLDGTVVQIKEEKKWPSVARCTAGQISTDSFPCDHNNTMEHPLEGTVVQIKTEKKWPSVARCTAGQISTDSFPCDHNNDMEHPLDGTVVQVEAKSAYRPAIKCKDPKFGNPISCDWDDITSLNDAPIKPTIFHNTKVKVIEGGPTVKGPLDDAVKAGPKADQI